MSTNQPAPSQPSAGGYLSGLDGLRGLAVVGVVLYHDDFRWMKGGFLGVSAFFTLSGFLIARLLWTEMARTQTVSFQRFWNRRFRRLFPASVCVVSLIVVGAALGLWTPSQRVGLRAEAPASLFGYANWQLAFSPKTYAQLFSDPSPLGHFWSLAIETQFYLVFPLVLFISVKLLKRSTVAAGVFAGLAVASVWWCRHLASLGDTDRVYLGTDTRVAELLIGVAIGLAALSFPHQVKRAVSGWDVPAILALGALGWAWVSIDLGDTRLYNGGFAIHSLVVGAVLLAVLRGALVSRVLSWGPLVALGKLSYSIYLVHWPIHVLVKIGWAGLSQTQTALVRGALTLIFGAVLFNVIEMPLRSPVSRLNRRVSPAIVSLTAIVMALGSHSWIEPTQAVAQTSQFEGGIPDPVETPVAAETTSTSPPTGSDSPAIPVPTTAAPRPLRILVVGDSVAHALAQGMYGLADATQVQIIDGTSTSCATIREGESPIFTKWTPNRALCNQWEEKVTKYHPEVTIISRGLADIENRRINGREIHLGQAEYEDAWSKQMGIDISELSQAGTLPLVSYPPRLDPKYANGAAEPRHDLLYSLIERFASSSKTQTFDLRNIAIELGLLTRYDGVHFTVEDNDKFSAAVLPKLVEIAQTRRSQSEAATTSTVAPAATPVHRPVLVVGPESARPVLAELSSRGIEVVDGIADCPLVESLTSQDCRNRNAVAADWIARPGDGTVVVFPTTDPKIWDGQNSMAVSGTTLTWLYGASGPDTKIVVMPRMEFLLGTSTRPDIDTNFLGLNAKFGTPLPSLPASSAPSAWADTIASAVAAK